MPGDPPARRRRKPKQEPQLNPLDYRMPPAQAAPVASQHSSIPPPVPSYAQFNPYIPACYRTPAANGAAYIIGGAASVAPADHGPAARRFVDPYDSSSVMPSDAHSGQFETQLPPYAAPTWTTSDQLAGFTAAHFYNAADAGFHPGWPPGAEGHDDPLVSQLPAALETPGEDIGPMHWSPLNVNHLAASTSTLNANAATSTYVDELLAHSKADLPSPSHTPHANDVMLPAATSRPPVATRQRTPTPPPLPPPPLAPSAPQMRPSVALTQMLAPLYNYLRQFAPPDGPAYFVADPMAEASIRMPYAVAGPGPEASQRAVALQALPRTLSATGSGASWVAPPRPTANFLTSSDSSGRESPSAGTATVPLAPDATTLSLESTLVAVEPHRRLPDSLTAGSSTVASTEASPRGLTTAAPHDLARAPQTSQQHLSAPPPLGSAGFAKRDSFRSDASTAGKQTSETRPRVGSGFTAQQVLSTSSSFFQFTSSGGAAIVGSMPSNTPQGQSTFGAHLSPTPTFTTLLPRILTEPSELTHRVHSDGNMYEVDNVYGDLVLFVGMLLCDRYEVIRLLGSGTFGQVAMCRDHAAVQYNIRVQEAARRQFQSRLSGSGVDPATRRGSRFAVANDAGGALRSHRRASHVSAGDMSYSATYAFNASVESAGARQGPGAHAFSTSPTDSVNVRSASTVHGRGPSAFASRSPGSSSPFSHPQGAHVLSAAEIAKFECVPEVVAVKIIKSDAAYERQTALEVNVVNEMIAKFPNDPRTDLVLRCLGHSYTFGHYCLVFDLLGASVFDVLQANKFTGLSIDAVREVAQQLLGAVSLCADCGVTHSDIKPENILLTRSDSTSRHRRRSSSASSVEVGNMASSKNSVTSGEVGCSPRSFQSLMTSESSVRLIDFGAAFRTGSCPFTYIQSRYYRAPEVILDSDLDASIDVWSVGCVVAEMFLGLPLFPGGDDYQQLVLIQEMLGTFPVAVLERGRAAPGYFAGIDASPASTAAPYADILSSDSRLSTPGMPPTFTDNGTKVWQGSDAGDEVASAASSGVRAVRMYDADEFYAMHRTLQRPEEQQRYFNYRTLEELVDNYPLSATEREWAADVEAFAQELGAPPAERGMRPVVVQHILRTRRLLSSLIREMLQLDAELRPSAATLLGHAFFAEPPISAEDFARTLVW